MERYREYVYGVQTILALVLHTGSVDKNNLIIAQSNQAERDKINSKSVIILKLARVQMADG